MTTISGKNFHFIAEGAQARAYVSDDQRLVLKVMKTFEEGQQQFITWKKSPDEMQMEWYEHSFESYHLAWEYLKEETGLIGVFPEGIGRETIVMLDGVPYDLSVTGCIVQHHAELVKQRIIRYMDAGDTMSAMKVIDDILNFIFLLWERDITDDTFNFHNNYGYLPDGKLIQVDIGSFWFGRARVVLEMSNKLILKKESFIWLASAYPQLADYLRQRFETMLKQAY